MRLVACLGFVALAAVATGCTATVTPNDGPPAVAVTNATGALTVDWSINETKDPNQCSEGAASAIEIVVTGTDGTAAGTYQQSCSAFATSITLNAGTYTASARLIDQSGTDRTTSVNIDRFTIFGDDNVDTPIDFGADSFL